MSDYTILLIDYDPRSIERLRAPLVQAGMRVEVAKDGLAGIKRFRHPTAFLAAMRTIAEFTKCHQPGDIIKGVFQFSLFA